MATDSVIVPDWLAQTQTYCGNVIEHLDSRDYQGAGQILREIRLICERADDPAAIHILNAALRICLACKQSQDEAEWHGRACAAVLEREQALRTELQSILMLVNGPAPSDRPLESERHSSERTLEHTNRIPRTPVAMESHGLWTRIQNLLSTRIPPQGVALSAKLPDGACIQRRADRAGVSASKSKASTESGSDSTPQEAPPRLAVCCLGPFQVYLNDELVADWRNGKSKSVFKYLIAHHNRPVSKEVLMDLFWPDANPNHARNSLNVTIYHIRHALSGPLSFSHVLFQDNCYLLNPDLEIWADSDAFSEHYALARAMDEHGDQESAIREYRAAETLYGGAFLEEDRYEEWVSPIRQALENDYLKLLDRLSHYYFEREDYDRCVIVCNKVLAVDPCNEEAHRNVMRCYSRQDQPNLAIRQYQSCVRALNNEIGAAPSPPTTELIEEIRNRRNV